MNIGLYHPMVALCSELRPHCPTSQKSWCKALQPQAVAAITLFFLGVTFKMHNFWAVEDPQWRMVEMVNFLKNLALMGSAWMFLLIPTPWPFSLGG